MLVFEWAIQRIPERPALKAHATSDHLPAVDLMFCSRFMIRKASPHLSHRGIGTRLILNLRLSSLPQHALRSTGLAAAVAGWLLRLIQRI